MQPLDTKIIKEYRKMVEKAHPDAVDSWPILSGYNVKFGKYRGWNILLFEHTGNPIILRIPLEHLSENVVGTVHINNNPELVRRNLSRYFNLCSEDALLILNPRSSNLANELDLLLKQHEAAATPLSGKKRFPQKAASSKKSLVTKPEKDISTIIKSRVEEAIPENGNIENKYQFAQEKYKELLKKHEDVRENFNQLFGNHEAVQEKYDQLLAKHEDTQGEYALLLGNHKDLQGKYDQLLGNYEAVQDKSDQLLVKLEDTQGEYALLLSNHKAVQGKYDQLLINHRYLQGKYNELQGKYDALQENDKEASTVKVKAKRLKLQKDDVKQQKNSTSPRPRRRPVTKPENKAVETPVQILSTQVEDTPKSNNWQSKLDKYIITNSNDQRGEAEQQHLQKIKELEDKLKELKERGGMLNRRSISDLKKQLEAERHRWRTLQQLWNIEDQKKTLQGLGSTNSDRES